MEYRDYYSSLGLPRTASQADIKRAFRRLARKHHPDVNKTDPGAETRFKEINEAYAVLGDEEKRRAYDTLGANWEAYQRAGAGTSARSGGNPFAGFEGFARNGAGPGGMRFEFHGNPEEAAGFSEFFRAFFSGGPGSGTRTAEAPRAGRRRTTRTAADDMDIDDLLAGMGQGPFQPADGSFGSDQPLHGNGRGGRGRATRQDLEANVEIDLDEVFTGTERLVQAGDRRLAVKIPKGVESGQRIRLSGKAGTGPGAGHVYLTVKVRPHAVFTREGANLTRELPITLGEALLGAEVPVATLTGRVLLRIPPETQSGRIFRLAHQGLPRFTSEDRGDLFVKTRVILPTGLDDGGRRLARELVRHVRQPDPRDP